MACRKLLWSAAMPASPTNWWGRLTPTISTRCSSPRSRRRLRRDRSGRQVLLRRRFNRVFPQQRILQRAEQEGERQHAEHLEIDPDVRRGVAPDDLIEHGERKKEQRPAQRQLAPAFCGEV